MFGVLILLALIVAVFFVFGRMFRRRVQRNLDRAGVELPAELALARGRAVSKAPAAARVASAGVAAVVAEQPHFVLIYEVGADFMQRRAQYRDEHLTLAWKAADAGELILAGALSEPVDQALLLFRGSREAALRFASADPYVKHGLVKGFKVRQWHTVVGKMAAAPARPPVVAAGRLK